MPSSNVSRAIGMYRVQITPETTSTRNETKRFSDQTRKTREVLTGDASEQSFEDVLRRVTAPKH